MGRAKDFGTIPAVPASRRAGGTEGADRGRKRGHHSPPFLNAVDSTAGVHRTTVPGGPAPTECCLGGLQSSQQAVAQKLLTEIWVAGNRFRAIPFIADKVDTLCGNCSQWGHSEFRCQKPTATCAICTGSHRTEKHRCEVATCRMEGKGCPHTDMECPNCGGGHPAQDARCGAKRAAIEIARGRRSTTTPHPEVSSKQPSRSAVARSDDKRARPVATRAPGGSRPPQLNWAPGCELVAAAPEWTED